MGIELWSNGINNKDLLTKTQAESLGGTGNITTATSTNLTGFITGNGSNVGSKSSVVITGTCSTARATTAKTCTISGYTLTSGDLLAITFTDGFSATSPTLSINGGTAINIKAGGVNVTTSLISVGAGVSFTLPLYYDGSFFYAYGSSINTTYSAITNAEIDAGTATTARAITGATAQYVVDTKTLKRSTGDFNSFTEKVTPISDDILLLEDSANSFSKAKVKVSSLVSAVSSSAPSYSTMIALGG